MEENELQDVEVDVRHPTFTIIVQGIKEHNIGKFLGLDPDIVRI